MDNRNLQKTDIFDKEYSDSLNRLYKENSKLTSFKWFLDTAYNWAYKKDYSVQQVVMLGNSIPEEIVIAAGAEPYWLIGGSLGSLSWSDDLVPRDTDSVSRSVLGYINRPKTDFSNSLFMIPLINDSMRKIAYQLKSEGKKICFVDIPPDRKDKYSTEKYAEQMKKICGKVSAHIHKKVTKGSVVSAMKQVSAARYTLYKFLENSRERTDIITDSARLFIQNSYYMTNSVDEWIYHVELLSKEVDFYSAKYKNKELIRPRIMLAGSPIIFPNYKIPFLIRDTGLSVCDTQMTLNNVILIDENI